MSRRAARMCHQLAVQAIGRPSWIRSEAHGGTFTNCSRPANDSRSTSFALIGFGLCEQRELMRTRRLIAEQMRALNKGVIRR